MGVSINGGTPKSSIYRLGYWIINHPFGDTSIYGNPYAVSFCIQTISNNIKNQNLLDWVNWCFVRSQECCKPQTPGGQLISIWCMKKRDLHAVTSPNLWCPWATTGHFGSFWHWREGLQFWLVHPQQTKAIALKLSNTQKPPAMTTLHGIHGIHTCLAIIFRFGALFSAWLAFALGKATISFDDFPRCSPPPEISRVGLPKGKK
jgi:hypothetical protein